MREYNLSFIDDIDLYNHVKDTIEKYRFKMNCSKISIKMLIDPIKLTFDSKIYRKTIEEIIESESS